MRVFILGAGASCCASLPLMKELLPGLVAFLDSDTYKNDPEPDFEHFRRILDGMIREFNPDWTSGAYDTVDVEELLSSIDFLVDMMKMGNELPWLENWSRLHLREVLTRYLWHLIDVSPRDNRLRRFVLDDLRRDDVIITFNWDVLVEKYLLERRVVPAVGRKDSEPYQLLKLHGSIHWLQLPEGTSPGPGNPMMPLSESDRVWYDPTLTPKTAYVAVLEAPLIIAPRYNKVFPDVILGQWVLAMAAINRAAEIYVIGYSLPKTDLHVGVLFSEIRRSEAGRRKGGVVVVNPCVTNELRERYRRHLGGDVTFQQSSFDNWTSGPG